MKISNHPAYRLESVPEPPDTLSEGAKQEWKAIAPVIFELRTARPADLSTLGLLCEILADIRALETTVRSEGYTVTSSGGPKPHPGLRALETARHQAQNLLDKFGLVPGSKARRADQFYEFNHKHKYG